MREALRQAPHRQGVEILDPATGTGTFIVELLEHFRGDRRSCAQIHRELHANEVAILPYYVANLNIEATYAAMTGVRRISGLVLRRHARQRRRARLFAATRPTCSAACRTRTSAR